MKKSPKKPAGRRTFQLERISCNENYRGRYISVCTQGFTVRVGLSDARCLAAWLVRAVAWVEDKRGVK